MGPPTPHAPLAPPPPGTPARLQVMSDKEVQWVNDYHTQVWEALSPHLSGAELEWLREATSPL